VVDELEEEKKRKIDIAAQALRKNRVPVGIAS
jgi:hypothetical protein